MYLATRVLSNDNSSISVKVQSFCRIFWYIAKRPLKNKDVERFKQLRKRLRPDSHLINRFDFVFNIGLSDTAVMDMMVSTLQQQRAVTEQLRREAAIKRIPVSLAVSDIVKYINEHEQEDCLLVGFSSQKVNPFREKSSCTVL